MFHYSTLQVLALALLIDAAIGYPGPVYRVLGHPVTWMGKLISFLDGALNFPQFSPARRQVNGLIALIVLLSVTGGLSFLVFNVAFHGAWWLPLAAIAGSSLIAQRSLHSHVRAVAAALDQGLEQGRAAVAMIVGRDPQALDEAGVARAAIESLAENFSDGVVAPAFWMAIGGVTGAVLYKAANTADSMIGHRSERYLAFGYAAARFDDLVNLPASRLAALWLALAAGVTRDASAAGALAAVRRDAHRHRSPNAGWPEAAMAGALGFKLNGPRAYSGVMADDAFMGDGRRDLGSADILRALALYRRACLIQWLAIAALAWFFG